MSSGGYAAIFDLDGVLTSTSARHERSWAEAAEQFGFPVTPESLAETRSVPRASSLNALLAHAGMTLDEATRNAVMAFKNQRYRELIAGLTPADAFDGAQEALEACRRLNLRTAVASASLNAQQVLERLDLIGLVDFVADPRESAAKPSPEIYGRCCAALDVSPAAAICIEDGAPMIANLRAEGLYTVGVGPAPLGADEQVARIADWDVARTVRALQARS